MDDFQLFTQSDATAEPEKRALLMRDLILSDVFEVERFFRPAEL
jgi:hypothetical protein